MASRDRPLLDLEKQLAPRNMVRFDIGLMEHSLAARNGNTLDIFIEKTWRRSRSTISFVTCT